MNTAQPAGFPKGLFWSKSFNELDLSRDRAYIVHQVLALGALDDWRWLFRTYGKNVITEVFIKEPVKIYTRQALNFSKLILGIKDGNAPNYHYDKTLPRHLG